MERFAVVSDIHSNIHALNAFMDYINNECKVSRVLNTGDFIQIGPNPVEVFDVVMNDDRFVNIMGNGEYMFFNDEVKKQYENEAEHQAWVINQLGAKRLERLKDVPLKRVVEIEGKRFLMLHSRPNSVTEQPLLYSRKTFEEFIADYNEDVNYVLIGHTHLPLYAVHWNNRPVINPGAVGLGKDGIVRFAIIEIDGELVNVTYKQLGYDKEKVVRDYREKNVPCGERFVAMFY